MSVYEFGPFRLNGERRVLTSGGKPVGLGPRVVETLLALVERADQALTKDELLDRVWPEGFVEEANLTQNIYVLRKVLRSGGLTDAIETLPRSGYRFTARVRQLGEPPRTSVAAVSPLRRRIAVAFGGAAFALASLVLVASHGAGQHSVPPVRLSDNGARLYQIGLYYWNLRTRDGVRKSLTYFTKVVDADPASARGYAALADANVAMGDYCYGTHRPAVYFARAQAYAKKALALDPRSAEAHAAIGFLALHRNAMSVAMIEFSRAIALDASYAPAYEWRGMALLQRGNAAGLRDLKVADRLNPLSVTTTAWLGSAAYARGRFDDAILYSRQALELAPQRTDALMTIGKAYEARGDLKRAIQTFAEYGAIDDYYRPEGAALLAKAYALNHRMREAREQLVYARGHVGRVYPDDLAAAAAAVGERDLAVRILRSGRGHAMGIENAARVTYPAV